MSTHRYPQGRDGSRTASPDQRSLMPSVSFPNNAVATLTCVSASLLAALVLIPGRLAAQGDSSLTDRQVLTADLQDAFVAYWGSGRSEYPPDLARVVDYWARYSLFEALITSALLVTLVALGRLLWATYMRDDGSGRVARLAIASSSTIVWGCALVAVWTLTDNIQDAAAPFAALLPMLLDGSDHAALAQTLDQVRDQLAHSTSGASAPPALAAMVDGNARFHVVHAVAAAPTAMYFLMSGVLLWKGRTRVAERRFRLTVTSAAAVCVLLSLSFGVICAVNLGTAVDPGPSLYGLFQGGW